jgi:hypothetical protein
MTKSLGNAAAAGEKGYMVGKSPLRIMDSDRRDMPSGVVASIRPGIPDPQRRLWFVVGPIAALVILAAGWCAMWYYAAAAANRTLGAWIEREAAAGRSYSCASEAISGFPFSIQVHCQRPAAAINSTQPPFAVDANDVTFTARIYRPNYLVGEVSGPLTVAAPAQALNLVATWALARISVSGLPSDPDAVSLSIEQPRVGRGGANAAFSAEGVDFNARIVGGSADDHPVIDAALHFVSATAPTVHPLLADPLQGDLEVVIRGLQDLAAKPLAARFRELQASGGTIEVKSFRFQRADATVVGAGTLTVNAQGRLDGALRVAVYGIENIVPQLGIDKLINQQIDRLAGASGQSGQAGSALDRLLPGLSGIVSAGANASLVDDLKKMGEPTQIDQKPAIALPLRFSDGAAYLGMIRLGDVPALF